MIQIILPTIGQYSLLPFQFEATWNDPKKSFISVTPNGKYFQTADGEVFFPVGQNLHAASCECDNLTAMPNSKIENPDCETCYDYGSDDPCCGLDTIDGVASWAGRYGLWGGPNPDMERKTEPVAAYQRNLKRLEDIKAAGANTVRMHMWPVAYEFEFEKLNNYYDRLFMASELDWYFDMAHELNMRVDFCMQFHMYYIQHGGSNLWDFTDIPMNTGDAAEGYCYNTRSDLTGCDDEPASFFREAGAKKYYKKKLRYLIARYGYSSAIMGMEFWSEVSNTGNYNDVGEFMQNQLPPREDYSNHLETRYYIGQWHNEMADYVKNNLKHSKQLLGTHHAGLAMFANNQNCTDTWFDASWSSPYIDYVGYSTYEYSLDRWQKWSDIPYNSYELQTRHCPAVSPMKPVLHLEQGPGGIFNEQDYTFFEKDLWCNGFSGFPSSGFPWGRRNYSPSWNIYGRINQFFEYEVFPLGGFTDSYNWQPVYATSKENDDTHDSWMEAVYLKYSVTNHEKAVGVVMNRLWNPATTVSTADTIIWGNVPHEGPLFAMDSLRLVYHGNENEAGLKFTHFYNLNYPVDFAPPIKEMGLLNGFSITYFNPYTLEVIGTSNDNSDILGNVKLNGLPALTMSLPYVIFKIVHNSSNMSTIDESPTNQRDIDYSTVVPIAIDTKSSEGAVNYCSAYPNPSSSHITINCSELTKEISIWDSEGRKLLDNCRTGILIYITDWAAGIYTIKVVTVDDTKFIKFAKQ